MTKKSTANRLLAAGCMMLAAVAAWAMPTKDELVQAQKLVQDLTADDVRAMKAGSKKPGEVAAAQVALADEAETEAGKYLLLQDAFRLYARSADYDAAADALARMRKEIADLPPELVVELVNGEMRRVSAEKAPKVLAILRDARREIRCRKELAAAEAAAGAKPDDKAAQRRVAECLVGLGDWPRALEVFAKIGDEAAKYEQDPDSAKDFTLLKAANYWWEYPAKDADPFKAHAAMLYKKGLADGSISGLRKALAEKRVKELESAMSASSAAPRGSDAPAASDNATTEVPKIAAPAPVPSANGKVISVKLATGVMMDFMPCPAGTFEMGVADDAQSAKFKHTVTITRPFWIAKSQVTMGQWQVFKASDLSACDRALGGMEKAKGGIRYSDATAYCNFLMKKFKRYLPKGYVYRLPTEAEWEYALHANCSDEKDPYVQVFSRQKDGEAWKKVAVENEDVKQMAQDSGFPVARLSPHVLPTMKVCTKMPNSWGVYDMLGNGVELLLDTVQIDDFKKRWGRNEHVDLYGIFKYKADEVDPLRMVSGKASCPCCVVRRKSKASLGNPLADKMVNKVHGGVEKYSTFRLVIGPDLLKERGIKLPDLGK